LCDRRLAARGGVVAGRWVYYHCREKIELFGVIARFIWCMAAAAMTLAPGVSRAWDKTTRRKETGRALEPDTILVERCLTGDQAAWAELVRSHTRRIYNLCYRFTNRAQEAEDLTQDVFLRVYKTLGSFQGSQGSFTTWLTSLTRNLLIDHYRKHKKERQDVSVDDENTSEIAEPNVTFTRPDVVLMEQEGREAIQSAITRLSPDLREAVILRDMQELEYREISIVLGVPEGTVKSRINRGRAALGQILRRRAASGSSKELGGREASI
jgi:RNA polymerase sigma-70 factor (ECF subfamily)